MEEIDYKNEVFWITGGTGFLGKQVHMALLRKGVDENNVISSGRDVNLLDAHSVLWFFNEYKPTVVIHAAAKCGGIGLNKEHPAEMLYDNLMMGMPLLHSCMSRGIKKFVCLGSVCSYPKFTNVPFMENDIWDGYPEETNAPYGIAKKAMLVQSQATLEVLMVLRSAWVSVDRLSLISVRCIRRKRRRVSLNLSQNL